MTTQPNTFQEIKEPFKNFQEVKEYFQKHADEKRTGQWFGTYRITLYKTIAIVYNSKEIIYYYPNGQIVVKKVPKIRSPFAKK